jgi:hypothetical protein
MTGTKKSAGKLFSMVFAIAFICLMTAAIIPGVMGASAVDLGTAGNFGVLGATTVTNADASQITGDLGVSPGTAITGFQQPPANTISGPGTVTPGLGLVSGTIYAGGPVAAQAHTDAVTAYNALVAQVPDTTYAGVTQLDNMTFTPGVYKFAPSANLQVNGNVYLDFQGDPNAVFIFQTGTTLVTMAGSKVIALNNPSQTCSGSNVYWAVGSSATIDGSQFLGTVIAYTTITMTSAANTPPSTIVSGRMLALNGEVTMVDSAIATCGGTVPPTNQPPVLKPIGNKNVCGGQTLTFTISGKDPDKHDTLTYGVGVLPTGAAFDPITKTFTWTPSTGQAGTYLVTFTVTDSGGLSDSESITITVSNDGKCAPTLCSDFVTGGGWINDKATFGVSGGIRNDKPWGDLSFNDHKGVSVKSTKVMAYTVIDPVTRKIEGIARVNGKGSFTYTVVVADNGEPGRNRDNFSLVLSNGYSTSGTLKGGNIQIHKECGNPHDKDDKEHYYDKNENDGHNNCNNDRMNERDLFDRFNIKNDDDHNH